MTKRLFGLLAALSVLLPLAISCGGDGDEDGSTTEDVVLSINVSGLSTFSPEAGTQTFPFSAGGRPSFVSSETWCTVRTTQYEQDTHTGTATISVTANTSSQERGATVKVIYGSENISFDVIQQGKSGSASTVVITKRDPAKSLHDASATAKAKSLYNYLLGIYGSKTVSGAQGGTAWSTGFCDYIYNQAGAGKYPGIVGFDYLFFNWPAKAWSDCPDYADITPVQTAYNAGNIIEISWHWTVPSSESGFVDVEQDGFSLTSDINSKLNAYSYSTKSFSVAKALTEGTWEHRVITYQIKRLAGYLKLLQDANIPVLFRPLHEAAGDYGWGAWFWWGYEGSEQCKALWKYLHDQLTGTYGIHNLIWVWTVQTSYEGKLADLSYLKAWYPGDDYVDIVGADLYVVKNTTQADAFNQVNSSVGGKKMVALTECGNLLNVDGYFTADAPWLWFLAWCNESGGNWSLSSDSWNNTAADWKKVLTNSHIVNRGSITY